MHPSNSQPFLNSICLSQLKATVKQILEEISTEVLSISPKPHSQSLIQTISFNSLVSNISQYLIEILDLSLQKENTKLLAEILQNQTEIQFQFETKMVHLIHSKITAIRQDTMEQVQELLASIKSASKIEAIQFQEQKSVALKASRNHIAKSLISLNRGQMDRAKDEFLPLNSKINSSHLSHSINLNEKQDYFESQALSQNLNQLRKQLSQQLHLHENNQKERWRELIAKHDDILQRLSKSNEKITQLKERVDVQDEKMNSSLEGLWNVITDLERKVNEGK